MTKRKFIKYICEKFNLECITPNCFVYVANCLLIGFVMIKVPGRNAYKLYFSIFPLWESSLKECLNMPLYQQVIVNTKNLDLYIPADMTEYDMNFTVNQCVLQIPFFPAKKISHSDIINYLYDKTISAPCICSNFVLKIKIYRLIYYIALSCNDYNIAESVYNVIYQNIDFWDDKIFQYWFGNKKSFLSDLKNYDLKANKLRMNLRKNLNILKISILPKYNFSD